MLLQLPAIFGDDMVLQRDMRVPVWGAAPAGETVTVDIDGRTLSVEAGADGTWRLDLPPAPAGGPYTLGVRCGTERWAAERVWRGEVWLAGGQSNMELPLKNSQDGPAAVAASGEPRLHFYMPAKVTTQEEAERVEAGSQRPRWRLSAPEDAGELSAVAYYAARTLLDYLPDVHVGVISCPWGGTYAHCWMPRDVLASFPEGRRRIGEYDARIVGKSDEEFAREQTAYQREVDEWNRRAEECRAREPGITQEAINDECGLYPWPPPAGRTAYQRPGNLWQSILCRVRPYAVRGFWYYQGEQDETWPEDYYALLTRLIGQWRSDWEDARKPFLLCQLPMFQSKLPAEGVDTMAWPVLREAQARAARDVPGVEMAVLADCGEFDNVHPLDKRTPGTRLGLLSLEAVYGMPVTGRAPVCVRACRKDGGAVLRFERTGGGLTFSGGGFQLAGVDGVFHDARARVTAPDTVAVFAAGVPAPETVRYAWYGFGPAGLHGGTGLAAPPLERELENA